VIFDFRLTGCTRHAASRPIENQKSQLIIQVHSDDPGTAGTPR